MAARSEGCRAALKRPLLIIVIFLLLGAVVNVAVAWGLAVSVVGRARFEEGAKVQSHDEKLFAMRLSYLGVRVDSLFRTRSVDSPGGSDLWNEPLPTWTKALTPSAEYAAGQRSAESRWDKSYGLPMLAMRRTYWMYFQGSRPHPIRDGVVVESDSLGLPRIPSRRRTSAARTPLRPIWPGFIANTIFYAAIMWLLICGLPSLAVGGLARLRVRRSLCPKCAYPIGESSVCTECGRELPKRASTP